MGGNLGNFLLGVTRKVADSCGFRPESFHWLARGHFVWQPKVEGDWRFKVRMRSCGIAAAFFAVCSPALADSAQGSGNLTKADCAALASYRPMTGAKGPDYQPGVDANGHYVAPADIGGGATYNLPERVEFDVTINPVNYAQRNATNAQIANTSQAIVQNQAQLQAAQARQPVLAQQLTGLQTTQTNLNTQQTAFNTQIATVTAQIIAQTGGAGATDPGLLSRRQALTQLETGQITNSPAYRSLQSQIAQNTAAIASTNAAIAANNAVIAGAPAAATQLQTQLTGEQGQAAALSGKFDNTQMSVGHVVVNTRTGAATLDGQPLNTAQDQYLTELCRRAGY